jgi:hypothetical protein
MSRSMRRGTKGFIGWLAIVAIALHTVLWGAMPMVSNSASASTVDPFSVICSSASHAGVQTDQTQDGQVPAPASACDHCNLCGTAAAPSASLDSVLTGQLQPAKLLQVLRPVTAAAHDGVASSPHQARGPPQQV